MSDMMRSSVGLSDRQKKILYRAWHRGMKEMDMVLGRYANAAIEGLSDDALDQFENLMKTTDPDAYKWLSGTRDVPQEWDSDLVQQIRAYHQKGE